MANWSKIDSTGAGEWFCALDATDALRWAKDHARIPVDATATLGDPVALDDRRIYPVNVAGKTVSVLIDARALAPQPSEWPRLLGIAVAEASHA